VRVRVAGARVVLGGQAVTVAMSEIAPEARVFLRDACAPPTVESFVDPPATAATLPSCSATSVKWIPRPQDVC